MTKPLQVFARTGDSYEAYRWAIESDNLPALQRLVQVGLGPNLIMPDGSPALVYAMQQGSMTVADWLTRHPQLDVNLKTPTGDTALMTACAVGELRWVETLAKRGGELDPANAWTPLHYAAANKRLSIVEYLVKRGVKLNALSPNGTTPLMMAARSNSIEIVKYLWEQGADASLKNEAGFTALAYAKRVDNSEMMQLLMKVRPVRP